MNTDKKIDEKAKELSCEQLIALMGVYLSEWEHRDKLLWTQVFRYFYATLIVIVLPNIASVIGIQLPDINTKLFPIVGVFMSIVFLYVGLGYAFRLRASSQTYIKIMKLLGNEKYERISIKNKDKKKVSSLFATPMTFVLVITMFISLIAVAFILLFI